MFEDCVKQIEKDVAEHKDNEDNNDDSKKKEQKKEDDFKPGDGIAGLGNMFKDFERIAKESKDSTAKKDTGAAGNS